VRSGYPALQVLVAGTSMAALGDMALAAGIDPRPTVMASSAAFLFCLPEAHPPPVDDPPDCHDARRPLFSESPLSLAKSLLFESTSHYISYVKSNPADTGGA